jgi:hypothetical protein
MEKSSMTMTSLMGSFPSKYLRHTDLNGRAVKFTMSTVKREEIGFGAKREEKPLLSFRETAKMLVLNKTNAQSIVDLYGDNPRAYPGKALTLFPAKVDAMGKTHDVIRVRGPKPGDAPAATVLGAGPSPSTGGAEETPPDPDPEDYGAPSDDDIPFE